MMDNLRDPNGQEEREPLQPGEDSQPMEETLAREEGFAQPAGPETPEELEPLPPEDSAPAMPPLEEAPGEDPASPQEAAADPTAQPAQQEPAPSAPAGAPAPPYPAPAASVWQWPAPGYDPRQNPAPPPPYPQPLPQRYPYPYAGQPGAAPYPAPPYGPGVPQPYAGAQPSQQPPASPYYYAPQPPAPQNPTTMGLGLKVFLWIMGLLSAGAVSGLCVYLAMAQPSGGSQYPGFGFDFSTPESGALPEPTQPPQEPEEEAAPTPNVDVTPNTEGIHMNEKPLSQPLDAESVYRQVAPSTVTVAAELTREGQTGESTGTGIIATSDWYIITNSHVVLNSKSSSVTVTTYDGHEYEAVVVGVDRTTDLAVLKTNDHGFTPAQFGDAAELSMGEWVLAIGNPGGARFSNSLTRGVISGLDREVGKYSENGMTYIQTDAAINPGNSGGPLVNMYGQVVGINSSKIITDGYEGMGFAIPVSRAQPIINELLSGGYIKGRTRLGITCREVTKTISAASGLPRGLQISTIDPESGFAGTQAQEGDVITAIEGETVESLREVSNLLLRYAPGDRIKVTLYRPGNNFSGGQELEIEIVLLEDKGETQK